MSESSSVRRFLRWLVARGPRQRRPEKNLICGSRGHVVPAYSQGLTRVMIQFPDPVHLTRRCPICGSTMRRREELVEGS